MADTGENRQITGRANAKEEEGFERQRKGFLKMVTETVMHI
jgi:hypothetical protein